jgi:hypothetical protein
MIDLELQKLEGEKQDLVLKQEIIGLLMEHSAWYRSPEPSGDRLQALIEEYAVRFREVFDA